MSIAVRVSVWILGVLVVVSAAVAVFALMQKQTLLAHEQTLQSKIESDAKELSTLSSKGQKLQDNVDQLNNKISQIQQEKAQIQSQYDEVKHKADDLQTQMEQANSDRDDWKNRVETMRKERDDLMEKLKNQPTKIVYRDRIKKIIVHDALAAAEPAAAPAAAPLAVNPNSGKGDEYWASVLRQKAALQIEVEKEKTALNQAALQVIDLKKQNSDLDLEIKKVTNEKDEIIQKIKYGQDLADNLSIDLARSRNDQKSVNDRADKLKEENLELQSQIRTLSSTKLELERNISRLTDDKDAMQKKLVETESIIQSRIDDIWKIKEGLDKKLSENASSSSSGSVELPPIIVNAPSAQQQVSPEIPSAPVSGRGKTQGSIISINQPNNFVIVDAGQENSAVGVGNALKVYRDGRQIASLEVIQVRRDICAADIKDKSAELKVGDIVRLN